MEFFINCNTSGLAPYTAPLDHVKVTHLYRRLGFSAPKETVDQGTGQSAASLVDNLISQAMALPALPAPTWADWNESDYPQDDEARNALKNSQYSEWRLTYTQALLDNTLRDRLSFFWSNHFVTELEVYDCSSFLYHYTDCLQRNSLGNFKTFIHEIGLTSAMLRYLDGAFNVRNSPNENYARELYELFSLGEGNGYTEQDIIETAKALTGYVERGEVGCTQITYDATQFDPGPKTILGQTGNWGYDDVIDILFEQRPNEIAGYISKKLYEFFVHPDSNDAAGNAQTIIQGMASTMISNNFEIAPVLSQLFKSQHFFDEEAIGVIIKSPFDLFLNFLKETGFTYDTSTLATMINYTGMLGQELFDPIEVEGWQRNRTWINTNFMIGRWLGMESLVEVFYQNDPEQFRTFALGITGNDGLTNSDPDTIARPIIDFILPKGLLNEAEYERAFTTFRSDVDEAYYAGGNQESWTLAIWPQAPFQVYLLIQYLVRQPEYQLK
ncbi:MAG: DUF1800 domain-containing protein [Sediminicola sp.]